MLLSLSSSLTDATTTTATANAYLIFALFPKLHLSLTLFLIVLIRSA